MIVQHPNESRLAYLLRVTVAHLREHSADCTTHYDGAECDGSCLADELQTEIDDMQAAAPLQYRFLTEGEQVEVGDEREVRPGCWLAADPFQVPAEAGIPRLVTALDAGRERYRRAISTPTKDA